MPGRYYDEWTLGDKLQHQPHRTVTETDNLLISRSPTTRSRSTSTQSMRPRPSSAA
jgi:hypothetical protein